MCVCTLTIVYLTKYNHIFYIKEMRGAITAQYSSYAFLEPKYNFEMLNALVCRPQTKTLVSEKLLV